MLIKINVILLIKKMVVYLQWLFLTFLVGIYNRFHLSRTSRRPISIFVLVFPLRSQITRKGTPGSRWYRPRWRRRCEKHVPQTYWRRRTERNFHKSSWTRPPRDGRWDNLSETLYTIPEFQHLKANVSTVRASEISWKWREGTWKFRVLLEIFEHLRF